MKRISKRLEPAAVAAWIAGRPALRALFFGRRQFCPLCESWTRGFGAHGPASRRSPGVVCPVCRGHGRHRWAWLYLRERTNLLDGRPKRLLHFAPEMAMWPRLRAVPGVQYFSCDWNSPYAMTRMDISSLGWKTAAFEAIYCSHVLEHVGDDAGAMREMFRVLKPGGWALVMVPVSGETTLEDRSVTDPAERERLYWQFDHVRLYGLDIRNRLAKAGFAVETTYAREVVPPSDCRLMGIDPAEPIFLARKPS